MSSASIRSNLKTIVAAFSLAIFIRIAFFEMFEIDGPSMEPTLLNGDRVVVAKFFYGLFLPSMHDAVLSWGMPNPGDVVIVVSPADNIDIVKRVIGVEGDTISIQNGEVFRNGESIRVGVTGDCVASQTTTPYECEWVEEGIGDNTWHISHSRLGNGSSLSPVEVPEGHIFVLGDHRDHSNDSRNPRVGVIPIERVKGRALMIYWSWDHSTGDFWHGLRSDRLFTGVD